MGKSQLVLGGPFLPHIEHILRDKASSMSSPVVSASDTGNRSTLKSLDRMSGRPFQYCDLVLQIEKDLQLVCKLQFLHSFDYSFKNLTYLSQIVCFFIFFSLVSCFL